ncbi:MAG: hypothetical protein R3C14_00805 [Caldilineaceae bacterium]
MSNSFLPILAVLAVGAIIFFACREIATWYLKVNQILTLLQEINEKLSELTLTSKRETAMITDHIDRLASTATPMQPFQSLPRPTQQPMRPMTNALAGRTVTNINEH